MKLSAREIVILGLMTALLLVAQVGLSFLPNIELVSLLIIVYTMVFRKKVFLIIYTFVLLEGLIYGFGTWWFTYLYVWTVLALLAWAFREMESTLGWAILNAAFGLMFGALTALTNLFISGIGGMISYWVAGIPFDLMHCAGNFATALVLFKPLTALFERLLPKGL